MPALVPSQYPEDAAEISVTFLITVTAENVGDVDGAIFDALEGSGLTWWVTSLSRYHKDHGRVLELGFVRPSQFPRPKAPRRKKGA